MRKDVIMTDNSYTTSIIVKQTAKEVFGAITNPRAWWGEGIIGETAKLNGEFIYRHSSFHLSTQKISELVPDKKVVWNIIESQLNFVSKKSEWIGTEVVFEISKKGEKTELKVIHAGLVPQFECFEACSGGWNFYLNNSLRSLIETGKGEPDSKTKSIA
jgi:uncharacterized protein YndB with AHSA1/START domain